MYENPDLWLPDRFVGLEQMRAQLALSWLPADVESVLDAGCGNGIFANCLSENVRAAAIDVAVTPMQHVKTWKAQASIESIPFGNQAFDATASLEVLEHLSDAAYHRALREIARVSRKSVLVSVPYCENLNLARHICPACGARFHPSHHVRSFDYWAISQLFAGLRDELKLVRVPAVFPVRRPIPLPGLVRLKTSVSALSFPPLAACPHCGYRKRHPPEKHADVRQHGAAGLIWRSRRLAKRIWPSYRSFRWWMALYHRNQR
jgi:SAM-dependent methyltransferase